MAAEDELRRLRNRLAHYERHVQTQATKIIGLEADVDDLKRQLEEEQEKNKVVCFPCLVSISILMHVSCLQAARANQGGELPRGGTVLRAGVDSMAVAGSSQDPLIVDDTSDDENLEEAPSSDPVVCRRNAEVGRQLVIVYRV